MQYKQATLTLKKEPDEDGSFEGYASVFDVVDNGLDVVAKGAFIDSLSNRKPKMLWQHDTDKPIGVWDEVREDEKGLFVKGRLLKDVAQGREAMALLRAGALDSMSIGYVVEESTEEGNGRIRRLTKIKLYEISLVTFPMLEVANVTAVKSIETPRDFERFLRDAGFPKRMAKGITAQGFKSGTRCDAESDSGNGRDAQPNEGEVKNLAESLKRLQEQIQCLNSTQRNSLTQ